MKKLIALFLLSGLFFNFKYSPSLKPYVMAGKELGTIQAAVEKTEGILTSNGFTVLGKYSPMEDSDRVVLAVTHDLLKSSFDKTEELTAIASVLRVGLHSTSEGIKVSYMNPEYWGNVFFRKKYSTVEKNFKELEALFVKSFSSLSKIENVPFGSKKGIDPKKLQKYHYKILMPYLDDIDRLIEDTPYADIKNIVNANFDSKSEIYEKVYEIEFPEENITLYGVGLKGDDGERSYIPKIDIDDYKYLPFAPYEILVVGDKAIALRGRFRIAISFPDLSMGTFTKIMSAPGDIKDLLKGLTSEK